MIVSAFSVLWLASLIIVCAGALRFALRGALAVWFLLDEGQDRRAPRRRDPQVQRHSSLVGSKTLGPVSSASRRDASRGGASKAA
jgi:hypothetical protein